MHIDRWVWMIPLNLVEKVVGFNNFHWEVGHPREAGRHGVILGKVVVVVTVL